MPRSTGADISARLQSLRNILNSHRHLSPEQQFAIQAIDREAADRRTNEEQERRLESNAYFHDMNNEALLEPETADSPRDIARARRQLFRPRERVQRQRDRIERLARSDASDQPSVGTSRLSPMASSRTRQPSDSPERSGEGRIGRTWTMRKRRKLDDGSSDDGHLVPSYGLEGTLVPGALKMKVVENDGNHESLTPQEEAAKLKLPTLGDTDLYRSKRNKCNVLMKHVGGWPFSLTKIVIKVPKNDYDVVPLQGMVFISMTDNKLLEKTYLYDQYFPASYQRHHTRGYDSYRPSQEYMRSHRPPFRSAPRSLHLSDPPNDQWYNIIRSIDEPIEVPQVPGFDVTLDHTPDSDTADNNNNTPTSPRPWHDINQDFSRRYADHYRPSYSTSTSTRERYSAHLPSNVPLSLSPSPSDSESEELELYRGIPPSTREFDEAQLRQQSNVDQARLRRERGDSDPYTQNPPLYPSQLSATGANSTSPRASYAPNTEYSAAKRLPGPTEMLLGKSPDYRCEESSREVMPHARFSVSREGGGVVSINFEPAV